jgi:hypothetical protein
MRVWFELERGQVVKFMVQLESLFDEKWVPVVRYDTAHNFAHRDLLHPYHETIKTRMETENYNQALTIAIEDIEKHWPIYRRRYETWLRKK